MSVIRASMMSNSGGGGAEDAVEDDDRPQAAMPMVASAASGMRSRRVRDMADPPRVADLRFFSLSPLFDDFRVQCPTWESGGGSASRARARRRGGPFAYVSRTSQQRRVPLPGRARAFQKGPPPCRNSLRSDVPLRSSLR